MTVAVTAAPGCHFTIPHPSGVPGLDPMVIYGGQKAAVSAARAEALWQAKLILHPVTGAAPPRCVADEPSEMRIIGGFDPRQSVRTGTLAESQYATSANPPPMEPPPEPAPAPRVTSRMPFPRALVDARFEDVFVDQAELNERARYLPWPLS